MKKVNKLQLRPLIGRDFNASAEFIAQYGQKIHAEGMFLPMRSPLPTGEAVELKFTLNTQKDIIAGTAMVEASYDGANGETPGIEVRFESLSPRSQKNLDMILAWQAKQADGER